MQEPKRSQAGQPLPHPTNQHADRVPSLRWGFWYLKCPIACGHDNHESFLPHGRALSPVKPGAGHPLPCPGFSPLGTSVLVLRGFWEEGSVFLAALLGVQRLPWVLWLSRAGEVVHLQHLCLAGRKTLTTGRCLSHPKASSEEEWSAGEPPG